MNCLEFKRLALSDPNCDEHSFVEHRQNCPNCLKYIGGILEMDSKLAKSLDTKVPSDLMAKLELNQLLLSKPSSPLKLKTYAKVACIATLLFVIGFVVKGQIQSSPNNNHSFDAESLVVKMINHLDSAPVTPVWDAIRANQKIQTLMLSYDAALKFKEIARLQFSIICPLDKNNTALHASLETDHGQITFAYVKGDPVSEVSNNSYKGYMARVKPVQGGNLLIISRNMSALDDADLELQSAMYWET